MRESWQLQSHSFVTLLARSTAPVQAHAKPQSSRVFFGTTAKGRLALGKTEGSRALGNIEGSRALMSTKGSRALGKTVDSRALGKTEGAPERTSTNDMERGSRARSRSVH